MTATRKNSKVKEFELDEEFQTKHSFNRIYAIGKVLIFEHSTGVLIQSSYYSDDSIKTIKTLRNTLVGNKAINAEFYIDEFLGAFGQILTRNIFKRLKTKRLRLQKSSNKRIAYKKR